MFATILFQIHDGSVSPENTGSWSFHVVVLERTAKLKKTTRSLSFLSRLVEGNEQASERARKSPAALLRFFFFLSSAASRKSPAAAGDFRALYVTMRGANSPSLASSFPSTIPERKERLLVVYR